MSGGKKLPQLSDLSVEQRRVVETWGGGMAVLAGAGSGKTTTLTLKCVELLKRKPEARFAAVSFTERSTSDLKLKLTQRLLAVGAQTPAVTEALLRQGPLAGHWVMTIHGLCSAIIREYPREAGFDGDEQMLSESEASLLWQRATELLFGDELPESIRADLDRLLLRESRDGLFGLIARVKSLYGFGALASLLVSEDPDSQALGRLGEFALERFERMKRRRGALDFDDLERGAARALTHERVREAYRTRFELVLVDEFQDTNPVQAGIISCFARDDLSNLCVIGDPKQSIYRFRDADVSVFDDFCARMPVRISLTANFRSRPAIIEYVNEVCSRVFAHPDPGMPYEALRPGRPAAETGEAAVVRLDVREPADLARFIATEAARGVPLDQMALLLRRIRGTNEKWLKALTAAGIPVAVGGGGRFWDDPRVRECVAFLKWWDNPGNQVSAVIFLRAPWVGVSDLLIDEWINQDRTFQGPFFSSEHILARALAPFRERIVRPGELLLALCVNDEVEAEIGASLLGLWHRVEELSSRGLDFHAVVGELSKSLKQSRRERDVPPPRNLGQVSVLTLHSSKGLEFPHVILVDFGEKGATPARPWLYWDRREGAFLGRRDSAGKRITKEASEESWYRRERAREVEESKRLFYVALTRAQERLVLVCPHIEWDSDESSESCADQARLAFEVDDWRGWIEYAGPTLVPHEAKPSVSSSRPSPPLHTSTARNVPFAPPRWIRSRHSVTEWNLFSRCPRAYEWTYLRLGPPREGGDKSNTRRAGPNTFEDGLSHRELGTRVHRCLQMGDVEGLRRLEAEAGVERFSAEALEKWVKASPLMVPSAPDLQREVWSELEFEMPVDGQILVGSIDRLIIEKGAATVIDFKVTSHQKAPDVLLESYRSQMELYALAVRGLAADVDVVSAILVNISPAGVQSVQVPLNHLDVTTLVREIVHVIQDGQREGEGARPLPGPLCRVCDFRARCPEALG